MTVQECWEGDKAPQCPGPRTVPSALEIPFQPSSNLTSSLVPAQRQRPNSRQTDRRAHVQHEGWPATTLQSAVCYTTGTGTARTPNGTHRPRLFTAWGESTRPAYSQRAKPSALKHEQAQRSGKCHDQTYQICRIGHYSLLYPSLRYFAERESRAESELASGGALGALPPTEWPLAAATSLSPSSSNKASPPGRHHHPSDLSPALTGLAPSQTRATRARPDGQTATGQFARTTRFSLARGEQPPGTQVPAAGR